MMIGGFVRKNTLAIILVSITEGETKCVLDLVKVINMPAGGQNMPWFVVR